MEALEYIKKFNMDQKNYEFNRKEFMKEFGTEFLLSISKSKYVNAKSGIIYYAAFRELVKNFEVKFQSISALRSHYVGKPLTKSLWGYFYRTYVVPYRLSNFPNQQNKINEYRHKNHEPVMIAYKDSESQIVDKDDPIGVKRLLEKYPSNARQK